MNPEWQQLRESGISASEVAFLFDTSTSEVTRHTDPPKKTVVGYTKSFRENAVAFYKASGMIKTMARYPKIAKQRILAWVKEAASANSRGTGPSRNYDDNRFRKPTDKAAVPACVLAAGGMNYDRV